MNTLIMAAIRCYLMFLVPSVTYAISAQWDLDPVSGDWNTADNWTPIGVPNGPADIATFGLSNTTNVSISANTQVNGITFTSAAMNSYTITASPFFRTLTLSGTGITNDSGITQTFVTAVELTTRGVIRFTNSATAGSSTIFTNNGGATGTGPFGGGLTEFNDASTAGSGTFTTNGAAVAGANGGRTVFSGFFGTPTAANGTFTNNGGAATSARGGSTDFLDTSTADAATLIANGGTNGGQGGQILFAGASEGGTSRVEIFGNGNLDISRHNAPGVTIGSIEGDGNVFLGANNLTVGSNNMDTVFSGVIQDGGIIGGVGGSLTKTGTGALTLSGVNTYPGDTNIDRGVLKVNSSITSNTFVNSGGTLAGTGTIQGNVTNTGGTVSPGDPLGTVTVTGTYTQQAFATLMINIASADQFSVLNVLGNANLNGFLDPGLLNGFVPTIGQTFTFLNYASLTGEFSHIRHQIFDNGMLQWSVIYQDNHAILTAAQHTPDQGSTFLLLMVGLLGLVTFRRHLLRGQT